MEKEFILLEKNIVVRRYNYVYPNGRVEYNDHKNNQDITLDALHVRENEMAISAIRNDVKIIAKIRKNFIAIDFYCLTENDSIEFFTNLFKKIKKLEEHFTFVENEYLTEEGRRAISIILQTKKRRLFYKTFKLDLNWNDFASPKPKQKRTARWTLS